MADGKGGWKAVDTAALRDILHAATAYGRVASAAKAMELGYGIEPDDGPSGRLGRWRIAGMPERACELFSKRSAEITAALESKGYDTYQARQTAARDTRKPKRHTPPADLMDGWINELSAAGDRPGPSTPAYRPSRYASRWRSKPTNKPPGKLRVVLGRARLKAEGASLAATAPDRRDPVLRRQQASLDRHVQLLDQRLEPWKDPFAGQAPATPAAMPTTDRSIRPTI
jgi:hypothetical protein